MRHENRVAWTEGMFLRVQHFQQADRWTERTVRASVRDLRLYGWGVSNIEIDREALSIGRFALTAIRGIMPDGTAFEAPGDADLPPAADLPAGIKDAIVYLALPSRRPGRADIADEETGGPSIRVAVSAYEVPDANAGSDFSAPIEVGRLRLRHLVTGDELGGQELIALARVVEVRPDQAVVLDEGFIPPSLNCDSGGRLLALLTELLGIVRHRAEAVSQRIGDPTVRGTAEVGDFLLLQTLNRAEPLLAHLASQARQIHPEDFYRSCLQLAGELATFTAPTKRATEFPPYRHDDLQATFAAVFDDLRASLSAVLEQAAVAIPLQERRYGVRVGTINDRTLLVGTGFVLAVRADMPSEALRRNLPNQIKVGPVERIAELVNVALPGIPVRPLPVLPRQLPYRSGTVYFELDTAAPMWKQLESSGAIALHLAGEFPGLELELWALKE
ncbi:type VI secretion system baseplate subunit TssK [Mesorhizobium sp. RP14(2022)]|uniref:Type VI secretion system baseplate subunit TssK n=1 Tax=Mesorhizobium liriopis TaxID=2953882 RepID=A0ABT1CAQ7_9HYPH|nr:type VI secretion system baseplate subunit TssK [Mesorhizobium liriopis]MCO6051763.1 type VI secretion system baseplate subunit TssK [Mesorhizobium liriopis]